jgi:hypothetical protein
VSDVRSSHLDLTLGDPSPQSDSEGGSLSRLHPLEPLTAPDCDLRDFAFMPLDVRRLLTSETWIEAADDPRVGHALMSLWGEAWHQVPAGSLPNRDAILARFAMCDRQEWERIKPRALQGWVLCSDGRLYHPVVAEKANKAWYEKLAFRERQEAFTESQRRKAQARWDKRGTEAEHAGGSAAALPRHPSSSATAMPRHPPGNAAHMPMKERGREKGRMSPQPGAEASTGLTDEDRFWSRRAAVEAKGIKRSQLNQLLQAAGRDFKEANRILDAAEAAKEPSRYLAKSIRNLEQKSDATLPGVNPRDPDWVNNKRAAGIPVEREGRHWRSQGQLLNDAGEFIGC